jgi:hypothetical protein
MENNILTVARLCFNAIVGTCVLLYGLEIQATLLIIVGASSLAGHLLGFVQQFEK